MLTGYWATQRTPGPYAVATGYRGQGLQTDFTLPLPVSSPIYLPSATQVQVQTV